MADLNTDERCDRCGAQAFAQVLMNNGVLDFCGHHFAEHYDVLQVQSVMMDDRRDTINEKPSVAAF